MKRFVSRRAQLNPRAGFNPQTGASPEMQLHAAPGNPGNNRSAQAEQQISEPPAPFGNPRGVLAPVASEMHNPQGQPAGSRYGTMGHGKSQSLRVVRRRQSDKDFWAEAEAEYRRRGGF